MEIMEWKQIWQISRFSSLVSCPKPISWWIILFDTVPFAFNGTLTRERNHCSSIHYVLMLGPCVSEHWKIHTVICNTHIYAEPKTSMVVNRSYGCFASFRTPPRENCQRHDYKIVDAYVGNGQGSSDGLPALEICSTKWTQSNPLILGTGFSIQSVNIIGAWWVRKRQSDESAQYILLAISSNLERLKSQSSHNSSLRQDDSSNNFQLWMKPKIAFCSLLSKHCKIFYFEICYTKWRKDKSLSILSRFC